MNATVYPIPSREARAAYYSPRTFYAYRISETGRTYPLVVDCNTLDQALDGGKVQCIHKEHLLIREVCGDVDIMHLYAIKQKATPRYVHKDHVTRAVRDLYAAPVCTFNAAIVGGLR